MSLLHVSSPHVHKPVSSVEQVMKQVLLATIPGVLVLTWFFGPGTLVNIVFGSALALAFEAWALWLRGKDYKTPLRDHSVVVTATLLCIALPPYAPWWLIAVGIGVSVLLGKHVFGGLGYNPFNPAMVGYVVLLVSFPLQMSSWTEPRGIGEVPGIVDAFTALFAASSYDAVTAATPLDLFRQNAGMLFGDLMQAKTELAGPIAGLGWDLVNLAFLAGGIWLLRQRIFTWHAPIGMLAALAIPLVRLGVLLAPLLAREHEQARHDGGGAEREDGHRVHLRRLPKVHGARNDGEDEHGRSAPARHAPRRASAQRARGRRSQGALRARLAGQEWKRDSA